MSTPSDFRRKTTVYTISQPTKVPNDVLDLWGEVASAHPGASVVERGFTADGAYIRVRLITDDAASIVFARETLGAHGFRIHIGQGAMLQEVFHDDWMGRSSSVVADVLAERMSQEIRYGHLNSHLDNGTGPSVRWLPGYTHEPAEGIQYVVRHEYERHEALEGEPTWRHLVLEEICEAFQESDENRLEEELIQVAALCVSWVERLRLKRGA